jgi:hypothetical protein
MDEPGKIGVSETNQTQKRNYCMISLALEKEKEKANTNRIKWWLPRREVEKEMGILNQRVGAKLQICRMNKSKDLLVNIRYNIVIIYNNVALYIGNLRVYFRYSYHKKGKCMR